MGFFKNIGADRGEIFCQKLMDLEDRWWEENKKNYESGEDIWGEIRRHYILRDPGPRAVIYFLLNTRKVTLEVAGQKLVSIEQHRHLRRPRRPTSEATDEIVSRNCIFSRSELEWMISGSVARSLYHPDTREIRISGGDGSGIFNEKKATRVYNDTKMVLDAIGIKYKRKGTIKRHNMRLILED